MLAPRTASTGLSISTSGECSATAKYQERPKSCDRATIMSCLPCIQDAYSVCRSTGSTLIWASNWPVEVGTSGRGGSHDDPLSLLTSRDIVGEAQAGQPLTAPYWGNRM